LGQTLKSLKVILKDIIDIELEAIDYSI